MKIELYDSYLSYTSRTKDFTLLIDKEERELIKKWFYDVAIDETEWEWLEDEDKEWFETLSDEDKDELEDFISDLE